MIGSTNESPIKPNGRTSSLANASWWMTVTKAYGLDPWSIESAPYRTWVESRVRLARTAFKAGAAYLTQVMYLRCRLAGYA